MNHENNDDLDKLLRDAFDGPVLDDGFSERVMRVVPRRRRVPWMHTAGMFLGATACWLTLSRASVLRAGWSDWLHHDMSPAAAVLLLAVTVMSLLALGWGLAEGVDRGGQQLGAPR